MYEIAFDRQGTDSPMNEEQNNQNPVNFNDSEPRQSPIQPNEFTFTFLTNDSPQSTESTSPSGEQAPHTTHRRRRRMSPQHIRRIKRRRRIRRVLIAVLILFFAILGLAGWFGISAVKAKNEVQAALSSATDLQEAINGGDSSQLDKQIDQFSTHIRGAYEQTSSPIWAAASKVPYFGTDVSVIRTAVTAMENIASQALPALQDTMSVIGEVSVHNGTINTGDIADVADDLLAADKVMSSALHALDTAPTPHFAVLDGAMTQARDYVSRLNDMVHNAAVFADLAPALLDTDGDAPRTYLILSQTNSELRPGGGLPGSWGTMTVSNGTVSVQGFDAPSFIFDTPVVELTAEERSLFTDKLGRDPRDVNFTPDFPRTGEIAAAMWSQYTQQNVDGVIAIDPVFLQRMLAVSGPITLSNGVTLDGSNTAQYLLNQVYIDIPENEQNEYFDTIATAVFTHIMQNANDPKAFLNAATSSIIDGHMKMWSAHEDEQAQLVTTPIAGALKTTASTPEVGVYFSDISQAKMDWYLKREVSVEYDEVGLSGADQYIVYIKLTNMLTPDEVNTLPRYIVGPFLDDIAAGQIRTATFVYAPAGGRLVDWTMSDGSQFDGVTVHDGLTLGVKTVTLNPGESYEITCHVQVAPGVTAPLALSQTPQVEGRTD